jgi:transposase
MYIDTAKSTRAEKTYVRYLLRDSYREDGKVKHRTIANLGSCSEEEIAAMKLALKHKGNLALLGTAENVHLKQGPRFGAVWALSEIATRLGISQALGSDRQGKLALLQVIARVITQGSRLSALRMSQSHAVSEVLGLNDLNKDELYRNLSWLSENQESIEKALWNARCAKKGETPQLFLYDVTSSYLEGEENELSAYGYNRDGKKSKQQIVIGLLTDEEGQPIAVRVFEGNTIDTKTVGEQVRTLADAFGVSEVTLVGDRGMLKTPQLEALPEGFRFITAITKPMMRTLLEEEAIQPGLFDGDLHEVLHDGIRYVVRRNPIRQQEIEINREKKFESARNKAVIWTQHLADHPKAKITTAQKHMEAKLKSLGIHSWTTLTIEEKTRTVVLEKDWEKLTEVSQLDGVYILKTDILAEKASMQTIHDRYKDLAKVESAFRTMKTGHLEVRPIFVRKDPRTRGHVFVVMLAYLLVQELASYWKDLDMTPQEGIDELSAVAFTYVTVNKGTCLKLPDPSPRVASLLSRAKLILPEALPTVRRIVHTKKLTS